MKNNFRQIEKEGMQFDVLALPNTGIFGFDVYNNVGSNFERIYFDKFKDNVYGVTHFIEHLAFKSTRDYSTEELESILKEYGSKNAYTDFDSLTYVYTTTMKNVDLAINTIVNIDMNDLSRMTAKELDSERSVVMNEIKRYYDNQQSMFMFNLNNRFQEGASPEDNVLGTPEIIEEVSYETLMDYRSFFTNNSKKRYRIVYDPTSDVSIESIIDKVIAEVKSFDGQVFKSPNYFEITDVYYTEPDYVDNGQYIYPDEAKQSMTGIKFTIDTNEHIRAIGNIYIKELAGENSMFNIIRDKKGLTYGVTLGTLRFKNKAQTYFGCDVTPGTEEELMEALVQVLVSVAGSFDEDDYNRLVRTMNLRNDLAKANLFNYKSIFSDAVNFPGFVEEMKDVLSEDISTYYSESIEKYTSYETVKKYLVDMSDRIVDGEYVLIKNY